MTPPDDVYTHGHHESVLRSHQWRTAENSAGYLLDALVPGTRVLDVGCGPGTITVDLAQRVAPGRVVGLDRADEVLDTARAARARRGRRQRRVRRRRRVRARPRPTRRSTSCTRTRCCSTSPIRSRRCARCGGCAAPGGVVAARDSDYATFTWWPEDPRLTRWLELYHDVARSNDAEPDAGRRLLAWARAAGFSDVDGDRVGVVLRHAGGPGVVGWAVGRPRGGVGVRRAGDRRRAARRRAELEEISAAWRAWSESPDAWFAILHGEIRATA